MGYFYFDKSIQHTAGFIIGAYVYSNQSPDDEVSAALRRAGLRPGVEEFKDGAHMVRNPVQGRARDELREALRGMQLGLVVTPADRRRHMGREALLGLKKILTAFYIESASTTYSSPPSPEEASGLLARPEVSTGLTPFSGRPEGDGSWEIHGSLAAALAPAGRR